MRSTTGFCRSVEILTGMLAFELTWVSCIGSKGEMDWQVTD